MYKLSFILLFCFILLAGCNQGKKDLLKVQGDGINENKTINEQLINFLKSTNEDWTVIQEQAEAIISNKGLLTMIFNHINIINQDLDYALVKQIDVLGAHGVIRVKGFSVQDIGPANRKEDSILFKITEISEPAKEFLINKRHEKSIENIIINLAVPHIYDPKQIVKKSTQNNQVYVVINIFGDFNRGGWNNTYKVMMFNEESEYTDTFSDSYTDYDYNTFYDKLMNQK